MWQDTHQGPIGRGTSHSRGSVPNFSPFASWLGRSLLPFQETGKERQVGETGEGYKRWGDRPMEKSDSLCLWLKTAMHCRGVPENHVEVQGRGEVAGRDKAVDQTAQRKGGAEKSDAEQMKESEAQVWERARDDVCGSLEVVLGVLVKWEASCAGLTMLPREPVQVRQEEEKSKALSEQDESDVIDWRDYVDYYKNNAIYTRTRCCYFALPRPTGLGRGQRVRGQRAEGKG